MEISPKIGNMSFVVVALVAVSGIIDVSKGNDSLMTDFDKAMQAEPVNTEGWCSRYDLRHLPGGIEIPCDYHGRVHPDYQKHYETLCALRTALYGD